MMDVSNWTRLKEGTILKWEPKTNKNYNHWIVIKKKKKKNLFIFAANRISSNLNKLHRRARFHGFFGGNVTLWAHRIGLGHTSIKRATRRVKTLKLFFYALTAILGGKAKMVKRVRCLDQRLSPATKRIGGGWVRSPPRQNHPKQGNNP